MWRMSLFSAGDIHKALPIAPREAQNEEVTDHPNADKPV